MADRSALSQMLIGIMGEDHVYFQPPESIRLNYPCIVYKLQRLEQHYADGIKYNNMRCYSLIFISKDADDPLIDLIDELPYCSHQDRYISSNLYHDSFIIYH